QNVRIYFRGLSSLRGIDNLCVILKLEEILIPHRLNSALIVNVFTDSVQKPDFFATEPII
ncbi:MAG TPA: hypothetical protein VGK06_14655, partial [Methanosarcina sp.]